MTAIAKSAKRHHAAKKCCDWEEPAIYGAYTHLRTSCHSSPAFYMDAGEMGEEQEIKVNYISNKISFTEAHEVEDKEDLYTEIAKHTSMDVNFITNVHTFVT